MLLGHTHTGKTSLVLRFVEGNYKDHRSATVGAFFLTKRLALESMTCKLLLWDTAGQEQFQKLAVTYYKQAAAAIVCFDVSGNVDEQIPRLQGWLEQVQHNVSQANQRIVIFVAACKGDLNATPGIEARAKQLADRFGAYYIKTSAKTDRNVTDVFVKTAEAVFRCQQEALSGRGKSIPVTMGGNVSLRKRSFSPNNHAPSPNRSFRNRKVPNTTPAASPFSQDPKVDASSHADDDLVEMDRKTTDNTPKIMCDNGLLVCGDGTAQECAIL